MRAPSAGTVAEFMAGLDDVVSVGSPIFKLDGSATEGAAAPAAAAAAAPTPAAAPAAPKPAPPAAAAPPKAAPPKPAAAAAPPSAGASVGSQFNGSVLSGASASYVDAMHEAWRQDPKSVHVSWQAYFAQVDNGEMHSRDGAKIRTAE